MSYRSFAYNSYELGNTPTDQVFPALPTDIKIDAASNATTLILILGSNRGVAEGDFTYNSIKATFADVTKSIIKTWTTYSGNSIDAKEYFDPGYDLNKLIFGTYQQNLEIYKGDDEFVGSTTGKTDDQVRGGPGNDKFTGYGEGQYHDYFNGESGFDVAYLRGKASEYTTTSMSIWDILKGDGSRTPGFEVKDKTANRDGIDYYNNVERLRFSDKVVALDIDGNAGQAYRLYKAALNRTPDENGLAGWIKFMDDGGALITMAQQFIDSQEFRTKYGVLDNAGFVNQLYINVLNRNGEPAGVNGWVGGLNNGLSRADVLKGFSESGENQANVIGQIKNGIPYVEWWLS